jgi:hypothetical protein
MLPQLNTAAQSPHHQHGTVTILPALAPKHARGLWFRGNLFYSDTKAQTDAVPKARLLGLVLVPTRLILLLQAMLGLLRLLLRVLLAIIPPEVGLIKMRVTGGSEYLERFVRNWALCPSSCANAKPTSWQSTLVLS